MITSEKQYVAAKEQLRLLEASFLRPAKKNVPDVIVNASKQQIQELMREIQKNMSEYTSLIENREPNIEINTIEDLFSAPIRYRLATHMSIERFGQKVGVSPRQIARYEKEEYQNVNSSTLKKILGNLQINIRGKISKPERKVHVPKAGNSSCV